MRMPILAFVAFAGLLSPALAQMRILTIESDQTQSIPSAVEDQATPAPAPAPASPPDVGNKPETAAPAEPAAPTQEPPRSRETQARPPTTPARYSFKRADSGFLRLDTETGQIAYCSSRGVGWACQTVPEDRAALEQEIARLQDQVERLKEQIAALREPASPPAPRPAPPRPPADLAPPPPAHKGNELTIKLPSQEDIDRASAAVQNAWRRMLDMLVHFKNDMLPKG